MKSEKGFSLLETMIAMLLMGIVGVALLGGLATASRTVFITDERATAESLARSQIEYVRSQDYTAAPWSYTITSSGRDRSDPLKPSWWDGNNPSLLSSNYDGYTITVTVEGLLEPNIDNAIQRITVVVSRIGGPEVVRLEGYRSMMQ
jgi:prepilin-type N-terminal cleavage/methylation domain-containing protein